MKRIAWIGISLTIPILAWAQTPGLELYKQGKHAEAASALAAEVESSPENKELLTHLGLARVHAGDPGGGLEPLKKAIALDDDARASSRLRPLLSRDGLQPDRQEGPLDRSPPKVPGARPRRPRGARGAVVPLEDVIFPGV